jgi:type IV pilus assembly protein PilY1
MTIKRIRSTALLITVSVFYTLTLQTFTSAQAPDKQYPLGASKGDIQAYTSDMPLSDSFKDLYEKGLSYASPVISPDDNNKAQSGDKIYMVFFEPVDNGGWRGNLKKYGLSYIERKECTGRDEPEWVVVDKNGDTAVDCDGSFLTTGISYWSSAPDGGNIEKGGVGEHLSSSVPEPDAYPDLNGYYSFRNIFTVTSDGAVIPFKDVNNADLGVDTDLKRHSIINFIYGYTCESEDRSGVSGFPVAKREWILGDIIHSEPKIIDYHDPITGKLQYRYIAVGANDGMLHVFTDTDCFFNGRPYSPGDEIFAFVPRDLLSKLATVVDSLSHLYMVDGSPSLFQYDTTDASGYNNKTLVFGEREGGRNYWALDASSPDPFTWSVKWHISGGSDEVTIPVTKNINELSYTWNRPFFTTIKISEGVTKNIMILSGGYDPLEDAFPEAFNDSNYNGKWDTGEFHESASGGTGGYDKFNPGSDVMGRGVFIVDIEDGSLLFKATYGEGVEKKTGIAQTYNNMKYCFPADVSVIPFSEKYLLMYAADIYGQIWKIVYDYDADTGSYANELSTRWKVKPIFTSNPGSSLAPGIGSGLAAPFTDSDPDTPSLTYSDQGRKTFYSPDISFTGNEWTNMPVLYFGTGDRAHPRYAMISNRFYAVADTDSLVYETELVNLTCNELDADSDSDNDGAANDKSDDEAVKNELRTLFYKKKVKGFYRIMDRQGECKDGLDTDHTGEQILSQPRLYAGVIYFSSYQPLFDDPSNPTGKNYIYALDYSYGISALNHAKDKDEDFEIKTLEDSYISITDPAIPSGIEIITRGGNASGLANIGGKISGIAEELRTDIPEPPGGITQLYWEIE